MEGTNGVTLTPGTRSMMNSAATVAFGCPTSFCLQSTAQYGTDPSRSSQHSIINQAIHPAELT